MSEDLRNLIDGRWVSARSEKRLERENPADPGAPARGFPDSEEADVAAGVAAARRAWEDWRRVVPADRAAVLGRVPRELEARSDELKAGLCREAGLTPGEATAEVARAVRGAAAAAAEGLRHLGKSAPALKAQTLSTGYRAPIGVCGIITSGDGAAEQASLQVVGALVCGNTVVLKPSEICPGVAGTVVEAVLAAGVPPAAVNLVHGRGVRAGATLAAHPDVRLVAFTGSTGTGRTVAAAAAPRLKRVALHLGAQNALLVVDDADLDLAVAGALRGAFLRAGQCATSTSRVVVHRRIADAFTARFVEAARALQVGPPLAPGAQMGPVWSRDHLQRTLDLVKTARKEGAEVLYGGERLEGDGIAGGWFLSPTVLAGVGTAMRVAQEEIWGPVASILVVDSMEEGIHVVNDSDYGLTASIYTEDLNRALRMLHEVQAAAVVFNAPGVDIDVPWSLGGDRDSAYGRAGDTLDVFTEPRTVVFDYRSKRDEAGFGA